MEQRFWEVDNQGVEKDDDEISLSCMIGLVLRLFYYSTGTGTSTMQSMSSA